MNEKEALREKLKEAEKVLVGIGREWGLRCGGGDVRNCRLGDAGQEALQKAYERLFGLLSEKDYYIVTTLTDGAVYDTGLDVGRIVAPCGNVHWRQCSKACTKDIWEEGEVKDDVCPHCGAPLTGNTIQAETYIEEGYLPRWESYKKWQAATLNKRLLVLELGEGFETPTVMRWPFEKITFFNKKASLYRINSQFYQVPKEVEGKAWGIKADSVEFMRSL